MKKSILGLSVFLFYFSSSVSYAERPIRGTYEVPVSDNLKSYASYPVKFKSNNYQETPSTISFPMPSTLMGEETLVTMSKVEGQDTAWAGENVNGDCITIDRYFKCTVKFNNIAIDEEKLNTSIQQQYKTPEEKIGRTQVAMFFRDEPIGILIYKMRGRGK